jgi:hypothetical protein
MAFSLRRWRPRHLLAAWVAYWIAMPIVALWPGIIAGWRATQAPEGHGTISASFANTLLSLSATLDGVTIWSGSAYLAEMALWLAGPPLILWLAWLRSKPRMEAAPTPELQAGQMPPRMKTDREPVGAEKRR